MVFKMKLDPAFAFSDLHVKFDGFAGNEGVQVLD